MGTVQEGLLPSLYATSEDCSRWIGVLDMLCAQMSVRNAAAQIFERDDDKLCELWTARDSHSLAHAALHDQRVNNAANPRLDLRLRGQPPTIARDSDMFDSHCVQYARLRSRLASIGLGYSICASFEVSPNRYFALIMHRGIDDDRDFGEAEEAGLLELLPHLKQTMHLSSVLAEMRSNLSSLEQALDRVRTGVLLCDASARVHWSNRSAEFMIGQSSLLKLVGGRLSCTRQADSVLVRNLLRSTDCAAGCPVAVLGEQPQEVIQLLAAPMDAAGTTPTLAASEDLRVLFLSKPGAPLDIMPEDLSRLFSLSPAEARLATAIAGGTSVATYSRSRGISEGTARVQLKQVLAKTQAGRQAELMRQICGSIVAQTISRPH